ncbi:hypothetical protein B0H14DRAFT_3528329 [Mycena olivaceomarginata]|nr:hypothetical protein B0H14DRAFT_3528329 [Mycena olivaceomarginata]
MNKQSEFFDSREMPLPALFRAAGYDQNTRIAGLSDVDGPGAWNKALERAAEMKAERDRTRRAEKEARDRASWEADQLIRPRPPPHRIRLIPRRGQRDLREQPLTEADLYLDDMRPSQRFPRLLHTCPLCLELKSHPVKLLCEHSACYVCLRLSLETDWGCPTCGREITRRPIPDDAEASAIERENSGWDDSQARLHNMEPKDGALTTAERLKQARRDKAQELQQRRAAAAQATKAAEDAEAAALDVRLRHSRVEKIERMRFGPRLRPVQPVKKPSLHLQVLAANPAAALQLPRRTLKRSFLPTTPQRPRHSLRSAPPNTVASSSTVPQISRRRDDYLDPDYSFVRDTDAIGFPCFHREPEWSEASDKDGYDPAGGLPYVPRWNVSSRRAAAMVVLAAQLTPEEEAELALKRARDERREEDRNKVRNALKPVHAQIIELGAERRERDCT